MKINEADLERLMSFVEQRDPCWFWDGPRNGTYHPVFVVDGVTCCPKDILYQNLCGKPLGETGSKCKVAGCINPVHMVGGPRADYAKLDGMKVRHILESDESSKKLAETYGVSTKAICDIWSGKSWVGVPGERVNSRKRARANRERLKLKPKRIRVGAAGIMFDPDTRKYVASYYKKHIGESDSLEGAVALRAKHIEETL